jgi:hydroxymethylbilane synthase
VGTHASVEGEQISIQAFVGLPDGSEWITDRLAAHVGDPRGAGHELAGRLRAAGAGELLRRAEAVG